MTHQYQRNNNIYNVSPCYFPLIRSLMNYLTDEELEDIQNQNQINPDDIINEFYLTERTYNADLQENMMCSCGVSITDIHFIRKNDSNYDIPIGNVCIKKFEKLFKEYKNLDKKVWNKEKYCLYCGEKNLRQGTKIHKKCKIKSQEELDKLNNIELKTKIQSKLIDEHCIFCDKFCKTYKFHNFCLIFFQKVFPVITFGRHKGRTLKYVHDTDKNYTKWLINTFKKENEKYKLRIMDRIYKNKI